MAANLRSSVGRTARRVSGSLLVVLRGPRPHPAAAAPSVAEGDMLVRKANAVVENDWTVEFARSLVEEQKKKLAPRDEERKAVPWVFGIFYLCTLTAGYHIGRDHSARVSRREMSKQGK